MCLGFTCIFTCVSRDGFEHMHTALAKDYEGVRSPGTEFTDACELSPVRSGH